MCPANCGLFMVMFWLVFCQLRVRLVHFEFDVWGPFRSPGFPVNRFPHFRHALFQAWQVWIRVSQGQLRVSLGLVRVSLGLVRVRARVFRFSLGKVREIKKIKISKQNNKKFFFCLNQTLRTNYGILMSKNVCFRLNRVRGIRICNRIFKIPSSFYAIAILNFRKRFIFCKK